MATTAPTTTLVTPDTIVEVVGFTQRQREWFLARDGHRCQFRYFDGKKWVRCKETRNLQVHHIMPRGFARLHMPLNFQLNGSMNGITLCVNHHVGQFGIHPDTFMAKMGYNDGNPNAFKDMMVARASLNKLGQPYWDTRWDWMFARIARKATLRYIRAHPYPANGNRDNTGRLPVAPH